MYSYFGTRLVYIILNVNGMCKSECTTYKKDGRYLNLYLDRALHEEFEQFCESLGQTKTVAAERAFRMYICPL